MLNYLFPFCFQYSLQIHGGWSLAMCTLGMILSVIRSLSNFVKVWLVAIFFFFEERDGQGWWYMTGISALKRGPRI